MTDEWLDEFNKAGYLAQDGKTAESLARLYSLAPTLREEETLTTPFFITFELRCAHLCSQLDRREHALRHFQAALKIAFEEEQDPIAAHSVCRELLEAIQSWQDWQLLLDTAVRLTEFARQHDINLIAMEAGWHLPYAFRGLGRNDAAREYAEVILERMQEVGDDGQIQKWKRFLDSIPGPPDA